jgi:hypothetical protein
MTNHTSNPEATATKPGSRTQSTVSMRFMLASARSKG